MTEGGEGHPTGDDRDYPPQREAGEREGADEEELRVSRSEEEMEAEVREREAGRVRARKSVRTDREQIPITRRREEVEVERVPVEGEARELSEGEIGEDEMVMRVYEEEIVVSKRVVLKEEIRLRKEVIEEEEIVEEDVRREEVEIDDGTERGRAAGND